VVEDDNPERATGLFFYTQTEEELEEAINRFERLETQCDPIFIREHARQFEESNFKKRFYEEVSRFMVRT